MGRTVLKISDLPNGFAVDIGDVAPLLPVSAQTLRWSLDDADAPAQLVSVDAKMPEVRVPYAFARMAAFWETLLQTAWGTYVAAPEDATLASFSGDYLFRITPEELLRFPFLLQAVDSSFFLVHSTDAEFLRRVEERFERVTRLSREAR